MNSADRGVALTKPSSPRLQSGLQPSQTVKTWQQGRQTPQPCDPAPRPEAFYIFTFVLPGREVLEEPASCQAPSLPACLHMTAQSSDEGRNQDGDGGGTALEPTVGQAASGSLPSFITELGGSPSSCGPLVFCW